MTVFLHFVNTERVTLFKYNISDGSLEGWIATNSDHRGQGCHSHDETLVLPLAQRYSSGLRGPGRWEPIPDFSCLFCCLCKLVRGRCPESFGVVGFCWCLYAKFSSGSRACYYWHVHALLYATSIIEFGCATRSPAGDLCATHSSNFADNCCSGLYIRNSLDVNAYAICVIERSIELMIFPWSHWSSLGVIGCTELCKLR